MSESTGLAVILIFALIQLTSLSSARIPFFDRTSNLLKATYRASSPLNSRQLAPYVPAPVPLLSPAAQPSSSPGSVASPPHHKHHKRVGAHASSPSFSTPQAGCDEIECSEPLTGTPIGSPCGCVFPLRIIIDLNVAPYLLFTHIAELEVEIASGTFLKQSQVKIMAAVPSILDQQKTRVTVYLVPLREKFDDMTAFFIYQRVSHKQILLTLPIFGDYQVVSVNYPGLPSAPPGLPEGSTGLGPGTSGGTKQRPLTADIHSNNNSNKSQKLNAWIIIVITVSSFGLVLACFGLLLLIWRWRNLRINGGGSVGPTTNATTTTTKSKRSAGLRSMALSASMGSSSVSGMSRALVEGGGGTGYPASVRSFSLGELSKATEEFSAERVIGEGGFGRVYRGTLETGVEVAVKLLTREDRTGEDREFVAEVEMLSRLHHRNLVKLIGICIQGTKRCLVYELITNGSVESHLHGVDKTKGLLNWETRMKIALGAARGLAYLHEDSNPRVIHRDFKASNILLEDDFTPKVTDFGLAREAPEGTHHISTRVMGTFGYVAPEYAMTGHVLVKSDVYSYGVVLLELLSGRKPVYMSESQGPENLVIWARSLLGTREGLEKLIDPCLNRKYEFDDVAKVASIASMCVHGEVSQRPFMGEVVQALKLVYNDTDDACDDSCSPRESESNADLDGSRGEWWNGNSSPFITMDYFSSGGMEGVIERPHSIDSLNRVEPMYNRSGPLRSKKNFFASFYRLRGSVSDHANLTKHSRIDRSYFN